MTSRSSHYRTALAATRTVLYHLGAPVAALAHPLGVKGFSYRRVKNDERDALGDRLTLPT